MSATPVKKLSVATVVGDIKKMVAKEEIKNGAVLYRCIGIADGIRTGVSTYGEWTGFLGDFELTNMLTGETFVSSQGFFDASFTSALKNKLAAANGEPVEFALECAIEINKKYATGFTYIIRPIMQNSVSRLEALRTRIAALPAPDAEKQKLTAGTPEEPAKEAKKNKAA